MLAESMQMLKRPTSLLKSKTLTMKVQHGCSQRRGKSSDKTSASFSEPDIARTENPAGLHTLFASHSHPDSVEVHASSSTPRCASSLFDGNTVLTKTVATITLSGHNGDDQLMEGLAILPAFLPQTGSHSLDRMKGRWRDERK